MMILISSCLLGKNCRYNGGNNYIKEIKEISEEYEYIDVCPEELGGLKTPRVPCEISGNSIVSKDRKDFTLEFKEGANKTLDIVRKNKIKVAILKEKSPSCGKYNIYDGSFSKKLIDKSGITAKILADEGVIILNEFEYDKFINIIKEEDLI